MFGYIFFVTFSNQFRFGIEAVTLEGVYQKRKGRVKADFHVLGRIVEGVFRSLNNLLERFHQSFFFYLLCSGSRYYYF